MSNRSLSQTQQRSRQLKATLLRTALVLGGLVLCFCFGFFVLARFFPAKSSGGGASSSASSNESASPPTLTPHNAAIPAPTQPKETKEKPLRDGPTIEAVGEPKQEPPKESLLGTSPAPQENTDSAKPALPDSAPNDEKLQQPSSVDRASRRERKRAERRKKEANAESQNAAETDNSESGNADQERNRDEPMEKAQRDTTPAKRDTAEADTSRLYRVQTGAFSTQEAAQTALQDLQGKGIDATVRRVKRKGRDYYSLQSGAYRNRASAEAARQKLQESGQDAYITGD